MLDRQIEQKKRGLGNMTMQEKKLNAQYLRDYDGLQAAKRA